MATLLRPARDVAYLDIICNEELYEEMFDGLVDGYSPGGGIWLLAPRDIYPSDKEVDFEIKFKCMDRDGKELRFSAVSCTSIIGTSGQVFTKKEGGYYRVILRPRGDKIIHKGTEVVRLYVGGRKMRVSVK